ncbi:hypothetical protein EOD42_12440 [Rhodovarius crocodyli]|uniref:Uncharacterized protein n=1 Tax=Rhodovarius crocodyli TaxID=1979269 RepID=A0A437ME60_9PROT|nr:DUF6311 domain-containing protein [Rhodovarius crocodyli]RVT95938.1 hypothetical protein EOD42_12440 [Rhodovarius crocodyli]
MPEPDATPRASTLRHWTGAAIAAAIGLAVVAFVFGPHILSPWSSGWMLSGVLGPDPVQYWLGWNFFREGAWSFPPGRNPGFGLELSSSVFYADAIPLLAFLFKALRDLVQVDQYWGMWLFACGALQGWLGFLLLGRVTPALWPRLAGAALFVLQPMLLTRMGGHFALAGQFLIIAGLWFCLKPGHWWRWVALVAATSLIHSYILPMVLALWLADLLTRRGRNPAEWALVPGAGILGLWAAGFFMLRAGHDGQGARYGEMQMDLLAPFTPGSWGAFLPALPGPGHPEVDGSYLGLGVLLLLASGLGLLAMRPQLRAAAGAGLRRHFWLVAALLGMLLVAITHRLSVGGHIVTWLPLPEAAVRLASALRASERFFWPLGYALVLGGVWVAVRALGARRAGALLTVLVLVQILDLRPGFERLAGFFPPTRAELPLRLADPFWEQAARRYARVRLVNAGNQARGWEEVAVFAAERGLETDAVYLARIDAERVAALNAETARRLAQGRAEPGTLYVLTDAAAVARALAGMNASRDVLARHDGFWVLAPGWRGQGQLASRGGNGASSPATPPE